MLHKLFDFAKVPSSWTKKVPETSADVSLHNGDQRKLSVRGFHFDDIQDALKIDNSVKYRMPKVQKILASMTVLAIAPTSTNRLVQALDRRVLDEHAKEVASVFEERIRTRNPYQQLAAHNRKSCPPLLDQTKYSQKLKPGMDMQMYRRWDRYARSSRMDPVFEPSLATFLHEKLPDWLCRLVLPEGSRWKYQEAENMEELVKQLTEALGALMLRMYTYCDTRGSAFFITTAGFIGVGPAELETNDQIVLCHGSRFPIALQPLQNGKWQFVGFCYVRGIMDQELYNYFPDLELKEREYILE